MYSFIRLWIEDKDFDFEKKKYEAFAYLQRFDKSLKDQSEQIAILKHEIEEIEFIKIEKLITRKMQILLSFASILFTQFSLFLHNKETNFYNELYNEKD